MITWPSRSCSNNFLTTQTSLRGLLFSQVLYPSDATMEHFPVYQTWNYLGNWRSVFPRMPSCLPSYPLCRIIAPLIQNLANELLPGSSDFDTSSHALSMYWLGMSEPQFELLAQGPEEAPLQEMARSHWKDPRNEARTLERRLQSWWDIWHIRFVEEESIFTYKALECPMRRGR